MLKQNIIDVKKRIENICQNCGRNPEDIKLLAVTKTHPAEYVLEGIDAGLVYIGENKIQEAESKLPQLENRYKEFHFIGHLQSNKIKKLIPLKPTLIHSIDKFSTAKKLNNYLQKNEMEQDILIQVNTSNEDSKFGAAPEKVLELIRKIEVLENINIKGLMTIGTLTKNEDEIRRCFRDLRLLSDKIKKNLSSVEMKYLSMGMSSDFEIAIEEGANIIRLGSILFGRRNYNR